MRHVCEGSAMHRVMPLLVPSLVAVWMSAAVAADTPAPHAVGSQLEEFLGEPLFVPMQQLWEQRGGWGGVISTPRGVLVAFQSPGGPRCRRSLDGGRTMPARIMGPQNSNAVEWRPYHYSTALYSDDGGRIWQTSKPFPVFGTGEAALAELSDGTILYNSREHMSRGNRFLARSENGGDLWIGAYRSPDLPDGARGTSYGLMGGMIRLPIAGRDVLLYSNADTDAGVMPAQTGASIGTGREKVTVWASFDGGRSWPVKRLVYDGPSAYSNLGVGRHGTPSQGQIILVFEGGPQGAHAAVQVASFNLAWLLDGRDVKQLLAPGS